jgi:hypothetical protein
MKYKFLHAQNHSVIKSDKDTIQDIWAFLESLYPAKNLMDKGFFLLWSNKNDLQIVVMHPLMGKAEQSDIIEFNSKEVSKSIMRMFRLRNNKL